MKRRKFLQIALASGSMPMAAALNCSSSPSRNGTASTAKPFKLEELSITDLGAAMRRGEYSARSITELYLERIEQIDRSGPALNSVIEVNPDALVMADRLDEERRGGRTRGPLHGIPLLIKDNIDTADRMSTTAGSLALQGSTARTDAFVMQKLREAGAVILGKTNLSEWANFRSTRSTSGWSARGGQTLNPYALDRNPCGSSSGSGAAVAANLCAAAIGTETEGSIICPCSTNGIVGIKPTVGLVGRSGIIPIAHSQDTAGPMARTVGDAAALLSAMAGLDPRDRITNQGAGKAQRDYTRFLDPDSMRGARIGVARNYFGFHDRVDVLMEEAIEVMKELGAVLVDPADIESRGKYEGSGFEVLLYEFKDGINKYLASVSDDVAVHSLCELIRFNEFHSEEEMPYFGQEIFHTALEKGDLSNPDYVNALHKVQRLSREEGIDATLRGRRLDAIVAPSAGPACLTDWINGDHFMGGSSAPAARAGYPSITVPAGFVHGLPVGISFFSKAYHEPVLIGLAHAYESATRHRRPPAFLPTVDFG